MGKRPAPSRRQLKKLGVISLQLVRSIGTGRATNDDLWGWMVAALEWADLARGEVCGDDMAREVVDLTRALLSRPASTTGLSLGDVARELSLSGSLVMKMLSDCISLEHARLDEARRRAQHATPTMRH